MAENDRWLKVTVVERTTHTAYIKMPDGMDDDKQVREAMNVAIDTGHVDVSQDEDWFIWPGAVDGASQAYQLGDGLGWQAEKYVKPAHEMAYSEKSKRFYSLGQEGLIAGPIVQRWSEATQSWVDEPYEYYAELTTKHKVGDEVRSYYGAPGMGHVTRVITRMDETGVYGCVVENTHHEMTEADVI